MARKPKFNKGLITSESKIWETPNSFFNKLNEIFEFTLDVAASDSNHKVARYFTQETNGLAQSWQGERCFMNPPYGDEIIHWMRKAYEEGSKDALVVCLLPGRYDTVWFRKYATRATVLMQIPGRLIFLVYGVKKTTAPFPSVIAIYTHGNIYNRDRVMRFIEKYTADSMRVLYAKKEVGL